MVLKIDLITKTIHRKEKFKNTIKRIIFSFCLLVFITFSLPSIHSVDASVIKNDKLIESISKDYTNKFCNSVAFGLSKESAMNFANKENNMRFKNKKGINSLNRKLLANKIATSVVETCGYNINLKGFEGISDFEKDYISINSLILKDK